MAIRRLGPFHQTIFFLASALILFAGFQGNFWRVAEESWFETHQAETQSFIVGRMVLTRQAGIFAQGGLTGLTGPDATPPDIENANYRYQYRAFLDNLPTQSYAPYKSQIGGQGMLFSALDAVLPLPSFDKLFLFTALTSLCTALVLSSIFLWFFLEFSPLYGWTVLFASALSQWLVVFGHNLWWSLWAFFLPMVLVLWFLNRRRKPGKPGWLAFAGVVFAGVLLKCFFNGYEYITTTLVMMVVPLVYFAVADRTGVRRLAGDMAAAVGASLAAVLLSMAVLCVQISAVDGSLQAGIDHIEYSFLRRTYADAGEFPPDYAASLNAGAGGVMITYSKGTYLDLNNYLPVPDGILSRYILDIRYANLILLFAAATGLIWVIYRKKSPADGSQRAPALIAATWFSLLAPLSWFLIFKSHSFIHTHMNYLVWQMPFTLFGFALCAAAVEGCRALFLTWKIQRPDKPPAA